MVFGKRQDRRHGRTDRMEDGFKIGVFVVEDVTADAVDEHGVHNAETVAAPRQAGLWRARKRTRSGNRTLHRVFPRSADGAAHPIQKRTCAFLAHLRGRIVIARVDVIVGEDARDPGNGCQTGRGCFATSGITACPVVPGQGCEHRFMEAMDATATVLGN